MLPLDSASEVVARALATGHIGTPVAVRIVAHLTADHGQVEPLAAQALDAAMSWLDAEPHLLTARGGARAGQITILARCAGGQTALVSAGSCGIGAPLLEIVVTGNRGTLAWEGGAGLTISAADGDDQNPAAGRRDRLEWIRESLRSGQTMRLENGSIKPAGPAPQPAGKAPAPGRAAAVVTGPKPQQPPYGVLLVSGDYTHQPGYAGELAADPRCKLIALTDEADLTPRRRKLNEQLARRLAIPLIADLGEALSRDDVHIVSICAEPMRRGRIIVQAAQAGKHLYLDKPLAGSLADADRIVAAVREARVVAHMFSMVRSPAAARLRQVVESGALGELAAIHFDLTFAKGPAGTAALGKARQEAAVPDRFELADSKRELTNIGVYPLVLLNWLLDRRVGRISAVTGNYFFEEHQRNGMEDFGQMLLELDGGLTASISVGRTGWRSHPAGGLNRVYLVGDKGVAVIDAYRPRVEVWADVEPWTAPPRDPDDPMGMWAAPAPGGPYEARARQGWITPANPVADVSYFLDCIAEGRQSDVSVELAAAVTEALLAGYGSAASGQVVALPLARGG